MKTFSYSNVKYTLRVLLILLTVEKIERENFHFVVLLLSFLSCITQKLYMQRIRVICTPNKCSTVRDLFLGCSCMWAKIGKLWLQTRVAVSFAYAVCACLHTQLENFIKVVLPMEPLLYYWRYLLSGLSCMRDTNDELSIETRTQPLSDTTFTITRKLQIVCRRCTYRLLYYQRCPVSVLELDERYDRRVMAPNTHRSLFPISHLSVLTHISRKLYRSYVDVPHIELLLYCRWHSLSGLEEHERFDLRATAPEMHLSFSDTTLWAFTSSPCIHRDLVRNYAWQQNSRILSLHTTHQTMVLLPILHRFTCIRAKLASYTTRCGAFSINRAS